MTPPEHEQQPRFDQIRPAAIKLSQAEPQPRAATSAGVPALVWIALSLLAAVAAGVIFLLPGWIEPVEPPAATSATPPAAPAHAAAPAAAPSGAAPYSQAQQAEQRKAAQAALERLLELQKSLRNIGVEQWAADEYTAAIRQAEEGDQVYATQDFTGAGIKYLAAVAALESLERKSAEIHAQALDTGRTALAAGNSAAAKAAFSTALLIRPDDADAASALQRAEKLDQVLAQVAAGRGHLDDNRLPEAEQAFQQALQLDPETTAAKAGLDEARGRMVDARFGAAMSRGFAALEAGDAESARKAFAEAAQQKPGNAGAADGLREAQNRISSARIRALLEEARQLEQEESWQDAVARYAAALNIDSTLLPGQQGRDAAAARLQLDNQLQQAIARPERLGDGKVRAETAALLGDAGAVAGPGPRLKKQIAILTALLNQAVIPLRIALQSNGETDVVIYKVGEFGRFTATEVNLIPGHYVAVGRRAGYRDARAEFDVSAERMPITVVVQCDQPVAAGR